MRTNNLPKMALVFPLILMALSSCQSTLRVTVERIEPDPVLAAKCGQVSERVPGASYTDAVQMAIVGLERYTATVRDYAVVLGGEPVLEQSFTRERSLVDEAHALKEEGRALLSALPAKAEPVARVEAFLYTTKVEGFLGDRVDFWTAMKSRFQKPPDMTNFLADLNSSHFFAMKAIDPARGFGGFVSNDVHTICASDPMYGAVLQGKSMGPITETASMATGDSIAMFVQESPTQIHVNSLKMDSTKIAANVTYFTRKILDAYVKFAVPGAAPAK